MKACKKNKQICLLKQLKKLIFINAYLNVHALWFILVMAYPYYKVLLFNCSVLYLFILLFPLYLLLQINY